MKRKTTIITISFLSVAVVALGILSGVFYDRSITYKRRTEASYQRAFGELVTGLSEMDTALEKSQYATSPAMASAICTEVFGKAQTAQMALGVLPFSSQELEQTAGFISRVGDYAFCLSRSAANGEALSDEAIENLASLSGTANRLAENLRGLQLDLADGVLTMDELNASQHRADTIAAEADPVTVGGSMKLIESEFPEIPSLIYDGPFSQHKEDIQPRMLEGLETIDEKAARKVAADFLGIRASRVTSNGVSEGHLPCYYLTAKREHCSCQVQVSAQGGKVVSLLCGRQVEESRLSAEEGLAAARDFLERHGYTNMTESYYMIQNNVLTANYAYEQDGVLCYPDLIKVSIALDNGALMGFEAAGYLTAHYQRSLEAAAVSKEEAKATLSPQLQPLAHRLAVIPTDGENERFCHEFLCQNEAGRKYLVYVDATTGKQARILILLEDENGALTI